MVDMRGQSDETLNAIATALAAYEQAHPDAEIVIYRHNLVSVRIRVIDPDFEGTDRADRHDTVWTCFDSLSEDVQSQITLLLLLTPDELPTSFANYEFDHPIPSIL